MPPDEATPAPVEETGQATTEETPAPSTETRDGQASQEPQAAPAEPFSDKFDPASLPQELLPAYKQLQGAATKKFQEAAALKSPDQLSQYFRSLSDQDQQAILEASGWAVGQQEQDDLESEFQLPPDPDEEYRGKVDEMLAWRDSLNQDQQVQQTEQMVTEDINSQLGTLAESTGRTFEPEEAQRLGEFAYNQALVNGEMPDVKAAYEVIYTELLPHERKRWVDTKSSIPQAPQPGSSASQETNMDDREERRQWIYDAAKAQENA